MRFLFVLLAALYAAHSLQAGEIVVYNQKWRGKRLMGSTATFQGKGYILLDFDAKKLTRISTTTEYYSKIYRVETYDTPVFAEVGYYASGGSFLAVQGHKKEPSSLYDWERTVFLKGKMTLLPIGPSQMKQVPRVISGLRRMTQAGVFSHGIEEDTFSATFNKTMTNDANGNSRTLEAQIALLTASLEEQGYRKR